MKLQQTGIPAVIKRIPYERSSAEMPLSISHRFSTVRMADRILFLEDGRLVEQRTHEELMVQGGAFSVTDDGRDRIVPLIVLSSICEPCALGSAPASRCASALRLH